MKEYQVMLSIDSIKVPWLVFAKNEQEAKAKAIDEAKNISNEVFTVCFIEKLNDAI